MDLLALFYSCRLSNGVLDQSFWPELFWQERARLCLGELYYAQIADVSLWNLRRLYIFVG